MRPAAASRPGRDRMALRWTRLSPQIALTPAVLVTLVAFIGSIFWTIYLSLTRSRRLPEYASTGPTGAASTTGCSRTPAGRFRSEPHRARHRQRARHRLRLYARRDDRPRTARRELLPHRLSLSARGLADRHRRRLALDPEPDARARGLPARARLHRRRFQLARRRADRDVRHHPRLDLAELGLLHGADDRRPQRHQRRDLERGAARWRQPLAALHRDHHPDDEVHLPDLRDPALARRHQGLRHRRRHDQWRPRPVDLGARLLHHQCARAEAEPRLRLGRRRDDAADHARRLPAAGGADRLAAARGRRRDEPADRRPGRRSAPTSPPPAPSTRARKSASPAARSRSSRSSPLRAVLLRAALCGADHLAEDHGPDPRGRDLRPAPDAELRGLELRLEPGLLGHQLRRAEGRLLELGPDPVPLARALDRALDRHRLRAGALGGEVGQRLPVPALHLRLRAVPDHHVPADRDHPRRWGSTARSGASRSSTPCSPCRC